MLFDCIVVGGGAGGLLAAGRMAKAGVSVLLLEKNPGLGKKLSITGKGRCNVTNACERDVLLSNVVRNPRFLMSAFSRFSPEDTQALFTSLSVPLKVERGNRVFPVSDHAPDIVRALERFISKGGVCVKHEAVMSISKDAEGDFAVSTTEGLYSSKALLLATGGVSYPLTGSTGDGYRFAEHFGHTLIPPRASLVPLETREDFCRKTMGLSLRNVTFSLYEREGGKRLFSDFGELLFTHFGLSGPLVLSASAAIVCDSPEGMVAKIDLKPALDEKTLDARICRDFVENSNKNLVNALDLLLPRKIIAPLISLSGLDPHKKVHSISKEERQTLLSFIKGLPLTIKAFRPVEEAIVTRGGLSVSEFSPKTMESKIVPGLYAVGEVLDVDALTGGFNLQIAFSTAACAADAVTASMLEVSI